MFEKMVALILIFMLTILFAGGLLASLNAQLAFEKRRERQR